MDQMKIVIKHVEDLSTGFVPYFMEFCGRMPLFLSMTSVYPSL